MDRRTFLRATASAGALTVGFGALDGLVRAAGYGPLLTRTRRDPVTGFAQELLLPDGFDFAIFGLTGTEMDDGHVTPLAHDGMAAFAGPRRTWRLVRNHEDRNAATGSVTAGARPSGSPGDRYDQMGGGGTTTLQVRFDGRGVALDAVWQSLAGTVFNCAGGPTSWGSWLSCEETTQGIPLGWERPHGYVFEVTAASDSPVAPSPLPGMGRFTHEAVAVDPRTGVVHLTEDTATAGFYRFVPQTFGDLTAGRLEMLKVRDLAG